MKKMTRILAPSIAFLMASLIALTGATYAWFQTSTKGTVAEIEANVVSASGMLMSWDANTWKSDLTFDETYKSSSLNNVDFSTGFEFSPVSTAGTLNTSKGYDFYTANVSNNKLLNITAVDTSDAAKLKAAGIVKFDLYFQVTEDTTMVLGGGKSSAGTSSSVTGQTDEAGKNIGLASRVAFVYQGVAQNTTEALALNDGMSSFIWEPNATVHTVAGCEDAGVETDSNAVFNYYGLKSAFTNTDGSKALDRQEKTGTSYIDTNYMAKVTTVQTITDNAAAEIALKEGYNKVTVYVWVEGQDQDCTNVLASTPLTLNLMFDVKASTNA